jgi:uncharacterized membrane protein YqgA involved in biofilm formation
VIGTIINVAGILIGGLFGLSGRASISPQGESYLKIALAVATVWFGLRLTWLSLSGTFVQVILQLVVVVVAMMLGKLLGRLLRLQAFSNRLGQSAREQISAAKPGQPDANAGFQTCSMLFCAAPLGIMGAITDGLTGYVAPLVIKGVIEAMALVGFARIFGWGCLLSALPVLALQGTIALVCAHVLGPTLAAHGLIASVNATAGLMIFSVALVILELKKVELADYLPSLAVAPLLTWAFR